VQSHAVRVPTIDIESIGAGGGSIAWIDAGGGVHIGPESSGAVPGPACYGRGGDRPTVTDCNLVLGFADPAGFLGGTFALDTDAAHRVIERDLARPLGKSVVEAAWIVRRIANALMAQAIRLMTVERGFDPREFAYICYGGGGPLHAVDLAAELEISRIVVPRLPGLFSAFGMLVADQAYDAQMPVLKNLDQLDRSALRSLAAQIEGKLHGQLARAQVTGAAAAVALRAECRYAGQAETLTVELDPAGGIDDLVEGFEKVHYRHWHFLQQDRPITLVNLRAQAVVPTGYRPRPPEAASGITAPRSSRDRRIFDGTAFRSVPTYQRESLEPGDTIAGPGCIEEGSSCLVFTGREKVVVDGDRNLVVTPQ
jgi:N-methylhydantoinase A